MIEKAVRDFISGNHATLGIITKTDREAGELYDALHLVEQIHLLTPDGTNFKMV